MKIKAILTMLIMLGGACMYALPDTADAARLGGGRSFGSRPSMSQPAQAPSAMQRQSTQQRQQAAQAQQPQRKGFLGGMGGLLGGKMCREDKFNMLKIARKLLRTLPTTLDLLDGKRHREVILLRCRLQIERRRIG